MALTIIGRRQGDYSATMCQVDDHKPRCSQPLSLCAAPVSRYEMALFPALLGETMHLLCVIQISMYDADFLDIRRDTPLVFKASLICFYWKRRYERQVARYAAEHRSLASSLLSVVMMLARKCKPGTSALPILLSPALADHLGSPSTLSKTSSSSSLRSTVAATPQLSSLKLSEICNDQNLPATASRISLPSPRALASPIRRIPVPRLCLNSTPGDLKTPPSSPRLLPPGLPGVETIVLGCGHTTAPPTYKPKVVAQRYSRVVSIKDLHPLKLIGWGAFGVVYLARDCVTQTELAVKVLCKAHLSSKFKGDLKPVFEEQRAMRMTHGHKGFLPLHASWHDSEYFYLATEYYPNGDLMKEMRQWRKIPPSHARFYAAEILLALDELHKLGVIHRDIKPPNLLFDREGHLSLADFGLARVFDEPECESTDPVESLGMPHPSKLPHGFTNTGCGTLSYMAPEAHQHKPYSFSVDFWSLGVLLYEMLTGRLPFGDPKQSKGIPRAIISDELTFQAFDRVDDITQDFLRLVMAKDPNARLSVAEMKAHSYFETIDWDAMANRTAKAPWIPLVPPRGSHTLCLSIPSGEPYAEGQDPHPSYTFTSPMLCGQSAVDRTRQVKAKSEMDPDNVEPVKFGTWKRLFRKPAVHRGHVEPARARPHVKRVAVPRGSLLFVLDKADKNTCPASEASTEDLSSSMISPASKPRPQQHADTTPGVAKAVAFAKLSIKFRDWLGWRS